MSVTKKKSFITLAPERSASYDTSAPSPGSNSDARCSC